MFTRLMLQFEIEGLDRVFVLLIVLSESLSVDLCSACNDCSSQICKSLNCRRYVKLEKSVDLFELDRMIEQ